MSINNALNAVISQDGSVVGNFNNNIAIFNPSNFASYYDDCFNTVEWDLRSSGTASACAGVAVTDHPGVIKMETGTDSGGKCSANYGYFGTNSPQWNVNSDRFSYFAYIYINALATVSDDYDYYIGPSDGWVFGTPFNGVYFRYYRSTSLNWLATAMASGSSTSTDTGIPVTTGWHKVQISGDSTSLDFYIDEVLGATVTTNIPSSPLMINTNLIFKTAGTTSVLFYQDYFQLIQKTTR